jgi:hypothetical protein
MRPAELFISMVFGLSLIATAVGGIYLYVEPGLKALLLLH